MIIFKIETIFSDDFDKNTDLLRALDEYKNSDLMTYRLLFSIREDWRTLSYDSWLNTAKEKN